MPSLVLVGAGHVHLGVLDRLRRQPISGTTLTVVDPADVGAYSGLLPPALAGRHALEAAAIPAAAIVRAMGGTWIGGRVIAVDDAARTVTLADGRHLEADVISLDVGARPATDTIAGAERLLGVRPFAAARRLAARIDTLDAHGAVVVIGAGAAGVELAIAIAVRRRRHGATGRVAIVDRADEPLPTWPPAARRHARAALRTHGIALHTERTVRAIEPTHVVLDDDTSLDAAAVVWAAGLAPHPLALPTAAARSPRGFPLVEATLRVAGTQALFGAGDGVDHGAHPRLEKSGVHAVRQAGTLAANLRAACVGTDALVPWRPRRRTLALLDAGDGTAILRYGGLALRARSAHTLKRRLDEGYVAALVAAAAE
ncbi:MAG: FAD-dependent oxidoreductase [Gemmatimonadaceae bacterium]|jgi:selenide,water dikinase|nr:FAD-dependent oxidoreductase [Gemmatimonadaceae bacterium]